MPIFFFRETKLSITFLSAGRVRNIYFPFDIETDTALSVAAEMVEELDITDQDVTKIADMIDGEIATLVPEWKRGLGIEGIPNSTCATFCHNCASNGSRLDYVSSNNPGAKNLQVLECSEGAAIHGRFEEITYQVEESEQCVTEGAPKTSSQSGGIHFADIWAQLDGPELSTQRSREFLWDEGSKTLDQSPFGLDERIINVDDQCESNVRNSLSKTTSADYALLDDYENEIRQELRWLKAKYQMQLRELKDQQLGAKWKSSSLSSKSPPLGSPRLKRESNESILESLPSGKHFTSDFPSDADKICSSVANQTENSEASNASFSPEKMSTAKNFYTGALLPHSLHRATSLPVDAVDF